MLPNNKKPYGELYVEKLFEKRALTRWNCVRRHLTKFNGTTKPES